MVQKKNEISSKCTRLMIIIILFEYVIYVLGVCVTYLFKFSEYEAKNLASFERYLNIVYFSIGIIIFLLLLSIVQKNQSKQYILVTGILCITLILSPTLYLYKYMNRSLVGDSRYLRSVYDPLCNEIEMKTESDSKIYCIVQESTGIEYWVMRFSVRPRTFNESTWSIGEAFYEGDIWTIEISPKEFQEELVSEYDYLAIYHLNDYFLDKFSYLFENPDSVQENRVYEVNKKTGLLEICE